MTMTFPTNTAVRKVEYLAFEAMKEHFRSDAHNTDSHIPVGTEFWVEGRGTEALRVICSCGWEWPE